MLDTLADIFLTEDVQRIMFNKYVLFIGDSVIRSMYKDFVKLLQTNEYLTDQQLKIKGEFYFENDVLLEGGQKGVMCNETTYTEVREYKTNFHLVRFYFITRCYSDYLLSICKNISSEPEKPDVVIMNSGVWDLTRYGPNSIPEYKQNLIKGLCELIKVLPSTTLFIWCTTLPLSKDIKGGFVIAEIELGKSRLREDVLEANAYAAKVIAEYKLDLIDLHFYFSNQIQRRAKDGIHWDSTAHRRISNLIVNHVCEAWNCRIPHRILANNDQVQSRTERYRTWQEVNIPVELRKKLDDIDLKKSIMFTNDNNNQDGVLAGRGQKRKRSLSQSRSNNANSDDPRPLMELNLETRVNNSTNNVYSEDIFINSLNLFGTSNGTTTNLI